MIEMNKGQIKKLETLRVALVYLFGSYAENKSSPLSDLDIGIVFSPKHYPKPILNEFDEGILKRI